MYALFQRFEINVFMRDAQAACHAGPCDDDVEALMNKSYIRRQLAKIPPDVLAAELREYGAWDDDELADAEQNKRRIVWLAAGDICEEQFAKRKG